MKRLPFVFLASFLLAFALWYFTGTTANREEANYGLGKEASLSSNPAIRTAARNSSTSYSSTGADKPGVHMSGSTQSVWEAFRSRAGFSSRAAQNTSDESQPLTQADLGNTVSRRTSAGTQTQDQLPPSISGRVLDDAGQPVIGMELSAQAVRLFQAPEGSSGNGIVVRTSSHDAGAYGFEELPEGEYRIRTTETATYLPSEIVVRTGVQSADLVVSGELTLIVQGSVKDTKGKALEGVRVVSTQMQSPEASTGKDGSYQLQLLVKRSDRKYVLKFQRQGYREETRQLTESQISSPDPVQVDARLNPTKSLTVVAGRVSNREGAPLARQPLYLMGKLHYQAMTNQAGEFAMSDVEANQSYKLYVPLRSPYRPFSLQVQVEPDGLKQDVVAERASPESGSLSGRMIDAAGNPLPRFSLWLQSHNPEVRGLIQVTSDDRGYFAVEEAPLGGLSFITQSQPQMRISGISLPEGGLQNINLVIDWGEHEVYGRVVASQDQPVPGSRVSLLWSNHGNGILSQSQRETVSDIDGFFRFAKVGPGVHSVRVDVPGFRNVSLEHNVGANSGTVVVRLEGNTQTALR